MGRELAIATQNSEAKGIFSARINTDPHAYSALFLCSIKKYK